MSNPNSTYRFGAFSVNAASGELHKDGIRLRLQAQPLQVLLALLDRPGELVSREELRSRLWPSGINVDFDHGINKAVNRLREVLCDDVDQPRFIETLPLRGYRFIARLDSIPSPAPISEAGPPLAPRAQSPSRRRALLWAGGAATATAGWILYSGVRPLPPAFRSLAVLPFEDLSARQGYFSDGFNEQLIAEIARIESLRVISRTSVLRYKDSRNRPSLTEIGRTLDVEAILEGAVQIEGSQVLITARLIRVSDDRHLWSKSYTRNLTAILSLQAEVAAEVARELRGRISPGSVEQRSVDPLAYENFIRARYFFDRPTQEGLLKAIEYFQASIRIDPSFAAAHAGLAMAHNFNAIFGYQPAAEAFRLSDEAAKKALSLNPYLAEAHNALADLKKNRDWDWPGAEASYQRAIQLSPSYSLAHTWYAECLSRMGRHDEALRLAERARILDPISTTSNTALGMMFYRARRYQSAIEACDRTLELAPHPNAHWFRALSLSQLGRHTEAVEGMRKAVAISPAPIFRAALAYVLARAGQSAEAEAILAELEPLAAQRKFSPVEIAYVLAALGQTDAAFKLLRRAFDAGDSRVQAVGPELDFLSADPRHSDLLKLTKDRGFRQVTATQ